MNTIKKGWHCAYQTHYHIVFPIKYRKILLDLRITHAIKSLTKELEERYDFEMEQIGCDHNHIHLLCSFHPKYSIGQFVRLYKSITAREIFKMYPEVKKTLWGGEFWSDGYYAATISEKGNWSVVEKYVKSQGQTPKDIHLQLF